MKIPSIPFQVKTDKVQVKKSSGPSMVKKSDTSQLVASDRVELSTNSMDVQKMKDIIKETPPIREDKVAAIKNKIDSGQYAVDSKLIAGKMLMSLLTDIHSG